MTGSDQLGPRAGLEALVAASSRYLRAPAIAVGWATVELDRAAAELEHAIPGVGPFRNAEDEALLGARCRLGAGASVGEAAVVLLEPSTEGRLAAFLARHGEGPAAVWTAAGDGDDGSGESTPGPFGPERLLPGRSATVPQVLLVTSPPTTIGDMTEMPPIATRLATTGDAERIATLFTEEGYPAGPTDIVARLERFAGSDARVVVAEIEGEVLGFVALHALPRFEHDDRIVRVLALVVDAGVRERGVGHLLMSEVETIAGELGAAFIEVTAGHHRPEAQRLFESIGYDASVTTYLRKRI